jgi:ligand-binding SRPBCC domain-containing protein
MYRLERRQVVPRPLHETFAFYQDPRNLVHITPRWLHFRMVCGEALTMRRGLRVDYRIRPLGFPQRWTSEITEYDPPRCFVDEQVLGPYRSWRHVHKFRAVGGGTEIIDVVEYELPFGAVGRVAHTLVVARQLRAIFAHRARVVAEMLR